VPRPIILGVVGDSAAGKTTITRGLVRILGEGQVTAVATDDYHRYDRKQRAERGITPLHPACNYMDIMGQHLRHLRQGQAILKPVYVHSDGTFGAPVYVDPKPFTIVEGLLGYYSEALRDAYDVRVYLAPPEELRRRWKVQRDTSRRGYTTDQVLAELDKREPDSAEFIRPQERYADMVVAFQPAADDEDAEALDAKVILRDGLPHPDLSPFTGDGDGGITLEENGSERHLDVPGKMDPTVGAEIEEAIWEKLHFATHLRSERLGEYTIGSDLHRSESLALVQLLILYHLVTAKASVALGGNSPRDEVRNGKEREVESADTKPDTDEDTQAEEEDREEQRAAVES
jgi:phosphoribulokinase